MRNFSQDPLLDLPPNEATVSRSLPLSDLEQLQEVKRGLELSFEGKHKQAAAELERVLQICENMPDPRFGISARLHLAKIYQLMGALTKELEIRSALFQSARNTSAVSQDDLIIMASSLVICYFRNDRIDEALALCDEVEDEVLPGDHWNGVVAKFIHI